MNRKKFLQQTGIIGGGLLLNTGSYAKDKKPVFGHNGMHYRMDEKWGTLDSQKYPVKDCHEMVQDSKGRILLLTNETKNNVLVYNKSGKLLKSWGHKIGRAVQ